MGVDFITCSKCRDTFPDCGPHDQCEQHSLCPRCMPFREGAVCDDEHHDSDGYLLTEFCPVCKAGGTELERAKADLAALRKAMIYAINHAGGAVSDDCSTEFLCMGADQIKMYCDRLLSNRPLPERTAK